jgi:hypothetical protein
MMGKFRGVNLAKAPDAVGVLAFPLPQGLHAVLAAIDRAPTYSPPESAKVYVPEPLFSPPPCSPPPMTFTHCRTGLSGAVDCASY